MRELWNCGIMGFCNFMILECQNSRISEFWNYGIPGMSRQGVSTKRGLCDQLYRLANSRHIATTSTPEFQESRIPLILESCASGFTGSEILRPMWSGNLEIAHVGFRETRILGSCNLGVRNAGSAVFRNSTILEFCGLCDQRN